MDERIGYVIKKLQAVLRTRMDEVLAGRGLTMPQYATLSALEREPGVSNAELARRSFVTPQTMIRIVGHLEGAGLIARKPDAANGKVLRATLTGAGKRLVASCHDGALAVEGRMLSPLTSQERAQLQDMLERCFRALHS